MNLLWQIVAADPANVPALAAKHGLSVEQIEALRRLMACARAAAHDPRSPLWTELLAALARLPAAPAPSRLSSQAPASSQPSAKVNLGSAAFNSTEQGKVAHGAPALPFSGRAPAPPPVVSALEPVSAFGETAPLERRPQKTLPFKRPDVAEPKRPAQPDAGASSDEQASDLSAQFHDAFRRRSE
jgi:hypothetical protein